MGDEMMSEKTGGTISEEDLSAVSQRYTTTTVLNLLQEIAQVQEVKIDWDAMVKYTKTGITNPREYQMLWRHLAYREPLIDKFEDDVKPLDDDSDLEYELEAFPTVSNEASTEAAAYAKLLMDSDKPSDSCVEKGLVMEAPLMINVPKDKTTLPPINDTQLATSTSGVNIMVPVFVPTQVVPTVMTAETSDTTNTCANSNNFPPRRKRKQWSVEEDKELVAAVQRCGEGNWANMSKGDFKGDRTASQLSQRWNIIKRRHTISNVNTGPQLSEVQLAARRAINMALDNPKGLLLLVGQILLINRCNRVHRLPPHNRGHNRHSGDLNRSQDRQESRLPPARMRSRRRRLPPGADRHPIGRRGNFKGTAEECHSRKTVSNGTGRPPVAPNLRYSNISPRSNVCLGQVRPNVGPVGQVNQTTSGPNGGHEVKSLGSPVVRVDQVKVVENLQKMNIDSGLKDQVQEENVGPL